MSYDAEKWARSQRVGNSSAKFVLIELANALNRDSGKCYPSIDALEEATELNRKTVIAATKFLEEKGFITKRRTFVNGKQVIYYGFPSFNPEDWGAKHQSTENGTLESAENGTSLPQSTESGTFKSTKSGTHESTENGTHESTVFGSVTRNKNKEIEQGKITRDIGASDHFRDVTKKVEKPKKEKRPNRWVLVDRPEGVSPEAWKAYCQIRAVKRVPLTEQAWKGIEREAKKAGLSLSEAIDICNHQGWAGFKSSWLENAGRSQGANKPTDPQYGIGVCQPPKEPTRLLTPEEVEESRRQMMEEGLIF